MEPKIQERHKYICAIFAYEAKQQTVIFWPPKKVDEEQKHKNTMKI